MTLITCPDCKTKISDSAISCIECYRPMEPASVSVNAQMHALPPSLGFNDASATCLRKYFDFTGRAGRSEYWYFYLFIALLSNVVAFIGFWPLNIITLLVCFIPILSAGTRRLHDTNKSGWRQLWILTGIGFFFVLYWLIIKGDTVKNSYDLN